MFLPRVCAVWLRGAASFTFNSIVRPDSDPGREAQELMQLRACLSAPAPPPASSAWCRPPIRRDLRPPAQYMREVTAIAAAARAGTIRKAVLARALELSAPAAFDPVTALGRLAASYPACVTFAFSRGERCFVGASPERLLRVSNGEARATCLAGTYPRGADERSDRQLAAALLADHKEREEHALVRDALVAAFSQACQTVDAPEVPGVLKLPNVQHLCTRVAGKLGRGKTMLSLVERLHPTPAVGGEPRAAALAMIREREGLNRGWYSGLVGWLDARAEGEFIVAIRAALLHGVRATLFAGCGIVAESDPEREMAESNIKMMPMLNALGAL
jgi:isochorismate synthase